jgi:hypothetical protein
MISSRSKIRNVKEKKDYLAMATSDSKSTISDNTNEQILRILFPDVDLTPNGSGEVQVISPLPRSYTPDGHPIYEDNPSASINIEKGLFFDFANRDETGEFDQDGMTLVELFKKVHNMERNSDANKLIDISLKELVSHDLVAVNKQKLMEAEERLQVLEQQWHFSREVLAELNAGWSGKNNELYSIPVYLFGKVVDNRTYTPNDRPKVKSVFGASAGMMVGKPLWDRDVAEGKPTIICAGEKDMLAIRSLGYNAIAFTGGERTIPKLFLGMFKGKEVYVAYDNDETGVNGGQSLALALAKAGANAYILNHHHTDTYLKDIKGGDMWDMVNTYKSNAKQWMDYAIELAKQTPLDVDYLRKIKDKEVPLITLVESQQNQNLTQLRQSNIQVLNDPEAKYILPMSVMAIKKHVGNNRLTNTMNQGQKVFWDYDISKANELLYLIKDDKMLSTEIKTTLLKIPFKEEGVAIYQSEKQFVTKTTITDYNTVAIENFDNDLSKANNSEFYSAYMVGEPLKAGKKYNITYRFVPNPLKKQEAVMVISEAVEIDSINSFEITEEVKQEIDVIRGDTSMPIQERLEFLFEQDLARVREYNNFDLWLLTTMTFHSSLRINYNGKPLRGYLDAIAIGETRSGKSVMANNHVKKYRLGKIINADGSTTQALLGGKVETSEGQRIRYGTLSREHEGLVILEEIKDIASQLLLKIRSVRSSQMLKIDRVAGSLEMVLYVRMLMLSNPRVLEGNTIDMRNNFNNGLEVLSSIVPAQEDQTRFDCIFLVDNPKNLTRKSPDPFTYQYADLIPDEYFADALRAIWTRSADQIKWAEGVEEYLYREGKKFSDKCDGMHNIYGTEASQKIARMSVALANTLMSFDSQYENIVVEKEHVDYIISFLERIYFNDLFRWNETMRRKQETSQFNSRDIHLIQTVWDAGGKMLIDAIKNTPANGSTHHDLQAASGLATQDFNRHFAALFDAKFLENKLGRMHPTEKFQQAYIRINKNNIGDLPPINWMERL